jgi:outer membrane protein OmpA-like peptidoglycan-associated protein
VYCAKIHPYEGAGFNLASHPGVFVMRSVITEISSKLFGLSVLIFILALLIPLLRGSLSPSEKGDTVVYEVSSAMKKTNEGLELEHTQSPAIDDGLQSSITQLQGEVTQSQSNGLTESTQPVGTSGLSSRDVANETAIDRNQGKSSVMQSLQTPPEPTIPQIDEKSTLPVNPIVTEEKRSPQYEPMSLLVLGGGFFRPGQVTPGENVQKAIDIIIPLIKTRSLDNVVIEGHADKWIADGESSVQASKLNKIISLQRANAVALVLNQKGVASGRIIVHGLGDAVPIASNLTHEGRAKNRRVEIKLLPAQ